MGFKWLGTWSLNKTLYDGSKKKNIESKSFKNCMVLSIVTLGI